MLNSPRLLTLFTDQEIKKLFKAARFRTKMHGLEVRVAQKVLPYGRVLIIVPKKYGNAPQRNLIKRRLRSIFYQEKLYEDSYDSIILVRPEAQSLTFDTLKSLITTILTTTHEKNSNHQ